MRLICGTKTGSSVRSARRSSAASSTTCPGQGRPIKSLNGRDDENWWVKAYLEREQLPLPLPTSLALRREVSALPETLADVADEESVREIVRDLNRRIAESHRIRVDGPQIVIGLVNVERAVADWRRRRA